jgi:hypothetical protein
MQDGFDVLKLMMGEAPNVSNIYKPMQDMMTLALRLKMASFIATQVGLSDQEKPAFYKLVFSSSLPKGGGENSSEYLVVADLIKSLAAEGASNPPQGNIVNRRREARALKKLTAIKNDIGRVTTRP